jgi:DNA repair protein RecN (Recombination protein N)
MLKRLYIKDYTLIDELDMEFYSGFSVITGETGAGKSIILGAIGLLLGNRADSKTIKDGCAKCTIEAEFDLTRYQLESFFTENDIDYDAGDCIIRRELTAAGKSRAFINDTPVSLAQMRMLGEQLVDVHSQHQNLLLQQEDFQLNVVDIISDNAQQRSAYRTAYDEYKQLEKRLIDLRVAIEQNRKDEEYLRFQYNDIQSANLYEGMQEELEQESETLTHAEDIKQGLFHADSLLNGDEHNIVEDLKSAIQSLQSIEDVYPKVRELTERLESSRIEIKDIATEINDSVDDIDFDPARLDKIQAQLDKLYALEQKFHVNSVEELLQLQADLKTRLEQLDNSDEELADLQKDVEIQHKKCEQLAATLTKSREHGAQLIEKEMLQRLVPLGIPNVRFQIQIEPKELAAQGADKVQFLFSANTSTALQPVSQVASGGEIARVMLSLKAMISGAVKLPTIIFDEIDTGVSGKIAQKMALMMKEMGENNRQVISITHLPQIAALGRSHYKVYKEETQQGTASRMTLLNSEERVTEIAQMLSGDNITDAAIRQANELLNS